MKTIGKILFFVLLWPIALPILMFKKDADTIDRLLLAAIFAVLCAICYITAPKQKRTKMKAVAASPDMLIFPQTPIPTRTRTLYEMLSALATDTAPTYQARITPSPTLGYHYAQNIYSPTPASVKSRNCTIKGNVNTSAGTKIYHCPGWRDYNRTEMKASEGDRWFCTEAEARAAGFRDPDYPHSYCSP